MWNRVRKNPPSPSASTPKVLYSLIKRRRGLEEAIEASLVENLIGLLGKEGPADVQREASITLALACFDEMAKITAIQVRMGEERRRETLGTRAKEALEKGEIYL